MRRDGEEGKEREEGESLGIIGILAVDAVSGVGTMLLMQILLSFVCVCVCHCSVIAPINKLAVSCMQLCVCVCACVRTCVCVLATFQLSSHIAEVQYWTGGLATQDFSSFNLTKASACRTSATVRT